MWYGLNVVSSVYFFLFYTETATLKYMTLLHIVAPFLTVYICVGYYISSVFNTA